MDTAALKQAAQAATSGPWELLPVIDRSINHLCPVDSEKISLLTVVHQGDTPFGAIYKDEDAAYIAAANPAAVLALIASHEQLVATLRELYATVKGECPSLLNENSGGSAHLDMQVQDALAAAGAA